jgi:hypothetical protein
MGRTPQRYCPKCGRVFEQFLPGQVCRSAPWWRFFLPWDYARPQFAVICWACKEIIGWE